MNMLERFLGHDLAITRQLLERCLPLSDEDLDREIDAGWGTLRQTFQHMIGNIEIWTDLMLERPTQPASTNASVSQLLERLESSYAEFSQFALRIENDAMLDDFWIDVMDKPPQKKTFGGGIGHVITHNMHHRAELLHIMHRLGIDDLPEGDLMSWDRGQNG